jgi:uncharacterized alpha-E superfamily protein
MTGYYSTEAERLTGAGLAKLDFGGPDDVKAVGLTEYIDSLQKCFNDVGKEIFETYVLLPSATDSLSNDHRRVYAYQQQQFQ